MEKETTDLRSAGGSFGLTRDYVTSYQVYELETERIFTSSWICLVRESDLDHAGGVFPVELENQKLILVKTDAGEVKAFRNFCRHRGSLLVTTDNCTGIGQRIQCPYHAWTYDRDGKLVAAPNMEGVDGFCREDFGLIEIPCEVYGGFVWINVSPNQSLPEFLAPVKGQFDDWSLGDLKVAEEIEYEVRANWKLIFQNYNECYHCPIVHPALNRLTPYKDASNDIKSGPILGGPMQLSADSQTMSTTGKLVGKRLPKLKDDQARRVHYFTIFPTIFLSTHPDYVLIHRIKRISVNKTNVICQFLFHSETVADAEFDPAPAVEFWDMTNRQDWQVCELAQAGMENSGYLPGPYSNLESVVAAFDRHYLSRLG